MTALLKLFDIVPGFVWAIVCAGALLVAGVERTRGASARQALAETRLAAEKARADAQHASRIKEMAWQGLVAGVIADGKANLEAVRADAERAGDSEQRMRKQLADYRDAVRRATEAAGPAAGGAPAGDALDLLADLFGRADARAGELARIADERGAAGTICERYADAVER